MDRVQSHCVDFLREQNLIAEIETVQENHNTILNLSCFRIEDIPGNVFKLKELKKLYLDANNLFILSENVSQLESLRVLTLDHNKLKELPSSLRLLKSLIHLNLSHNPLERVPAVVCAVDSLESLWINSTGLTELPGTLQNLKNLLTFGARGNMIQSYSPELCFFTNLRWLTLERNRLKQLPPEFHNLVGLRHLNLSHNFFEEIPPCLVHIKSLQFCFMYYNYIVAISEIMQQQMKHLKKLDLRGNPISTKINRKVYPYIVIENEQTHNTELESSDSEDYAFTIASSEINDSTGGSQEDIEPAILEALPRLSKFAFSAV